MDNSIPLFLMLAALILTTPEISLKGRRRFASMYLLGAVVLILYRWSTA